MKDIFKETGLRFERDILAKERTGRNEGMKLKEGMKDYKGRIYIQGNRTAFLARHSGKGREGMKE